MRAVSMALVALVLASRLGGAPPSLAIYGGELVPAGEGGASVRYDAFGGDGFWGTCSGVLVAERFVLTAGHCVRSPRGAVRRVNEVRVGNPRGKTARLKAKAVHVHPAFRPDEPEKGHDFALIELAAAAKIPYLPVLRSGEDPAKAGDRVIIEGYGQMRRGKRLVDPPGLMRSRQELLSPFACFSGPVKEMAKTRACAADPDTGVCPGDSGSPVIWKDKDGAPLVIGIVSLAIDPAKCSKVATVYGRLAAVADWLTEVMTRAPER